MFLILKYGCLFFTLIAFQPFSFAVLNEHTLNQEQRASYHILTQELRCPTCPNQALSDSNSMIAQDLKEVIAKQLKQHRNEQEIIDNLVSKYGHIIQYRPPMNKKTWLLWLSPLFFIVVGIYFIIRLRRFHHTRGSHD